MPPFPAELSMREMLKAHFSRRSASKLIVFGEIQGTVLQVRCFENREEGAHVLLEALILRLNTLVSGCLRDNGL